jgi:hypothetical protein
MVRTDSILKKVHEYGLVVRTKQKFKLYVTIRMGEDDNIISRQNLPTYISGKRVGLIFEQKTINNTNGVKI